VVLSYWFWRLTYGVLAEVKARNPRGLVPSGNCAARGPEVLILAAGEGSSITDREYMQAGGAIVAKAEETLCSPIWSSR
jgi:alanine dehydrogenase